MAASNIPLHCGICPKKPNFSDVSHLLTHISSKGHLAHHYKAKLRSSTEEESRQLLEAYDHWYAEWNVEELMAERITQKDKRRSRAKPPMRGPPAPAKIEAPIPTSTRPRAAVGALLDPRLAEHQQQQHMMIKRDPSITPASTPQPGPVLRRRSFAPRVQYWGMDSRSTSQSYTNPEYETSSEYSEPAARRQFEYAEDDTCAVEDDPVDAPANAVDDPMAVSESTKLKGVYWPGMDIFDSATPEMRRKRNQKKDSSVVEQLELNSQGVEATEMIFTPLGSFKRQRRISGSVCDEEEESSPAARKSPRAALKRPALANLDVNASRRPRQTRPQGLSMATRSQNSNGLDRSAFAMEGFAPRKRRTFDVFQDDEISFGQPAPFNYLTAGFRPHQPSPSPTPSFPYKPYSGLYNHENKENIMPAYQDQLYDPHHHLHHQGHPSHQLSGLPYHTFGYGIGQDPHAFQYHNHLYMNNAYQQQVQDDADDQRTLTAPPSPSTG